MAKAKRAVLLVVTSHGELGNSGEKTGYWLEELAAPYYALKKAGFEPILASSVGGAAPVDPRSVDRAREQGGDTPQLRWLSDTQAGDAIAHTLTTASLDANDYAGIFLVGGRGALWDMPNDSALGALIVKMLNAGQPVGSVCHAPAALLKLTAADGQSILAGRRMTCFSDAEERTLGADKKIPYLLESELRRIGVNVDVGGFRADHIIVDGNLISGQNPQSSVSTADAFVSALEATH